MGQTSKNRVIILIVCFMVTGILLYLKPEPEAAIKSVRLSEVLSNIKGWEYRGFIPFENKIIDALALDDYVNLKYSNGNDNVSLYIGYYLSVKKVGAAHDPMVCFPGQGWVLSNKTTGKLQLNPEIETSISYSMMTGRLGQQKELLVYWFQAYNLTMPDTFTQKLSLFWKKILNQGEDNAFVRITVPIGDRPVEEYKEVAFSFIRAFYPTFLDYVKS